MSQAESADAGVQQRRRRADHFPALWLKRFAYALIPALLSGLGFLWTDRAAKIDQIQRNSSNLVLVTVKLDALEKQVVDNKDMAREQRDEILVEIRELRGEVRQMYRRAVRGER